MICLECGDESTHTYNCSKRKKCKECGTGNISGTIYHAYKCPKVPKCKYCKCRTDILNVWHKKGCKKYQNNRKSRKPIDQYYHIDDFDVTYVF